MNKMIVFYIIMIINVGHTSTLKKFGDCAQIINPIIAFTVSTQHQGADHYINLHSRSLGIMGASKFIGNKLKVPSSRRPDSLTYTGMPSGHTTSSWSAAAYVRQYGGEHRWLAVPLYTSALLTAYSRVECKKHTIPQVLVAILLSETMSVQYRDSAIKANLTFNQKKQISLEFHINF